MLFVHGLLVALLLISFLFCSSPPISAQFIGGLGWRFIDFSPNMCFSLMYLQVFTVYCLISALFPFDLVPVYARCNPSLRCLCSSSSLCMIGFVQLPRIFWVTSLVDFEVVAPGLLAFQCCFFLRFFCCNFLYYYLFLSCVQLQGYCRFAYCSMLLLISSQFIQLMLIFN